MAYNIYIVCGEKQIEFAKKYLNKYSVNRTSFKSMVTDIGLINKENSLEVDKEKLDILDDFDKAMRIGHGQFNWVSADYLNNEQSNERYQELFKLATPTVSSDQKTNVQQESVQGV